MTRFFVSLSLGIFIAACSSSNPSSSAPSSGGASGAQVDACKQSCDKMKFFDCSSAEEQARCYAECDKATASQIQVFTGCATSSICDPECRTTIQPKDPATGTVSVNGTGASPSTCATACDKLVSCSFIPLSKKSACLSECTSKGYQYQIDCVNKAACDKVPSSCGGGLGAPAMPPIETSADAGSFDISTKRCESECDSLNFLACGPVESHATCRAQCSSAPSAERDTFTACSVSSGGDCERKMACLDVFLN